MVNILFVDDEPNILDGLKRMLRSMRNEWNMSFVCSGIEALDFLGKNEIDVVVSDMKMPMMDGAALLQEVRNRYPQIVRIILSGYSEKEMIMKSISATHQYLSKPCDPEILKETINRACTLRDLLTDEKLRRLISKMRSVPSLPRLYTDLMKELELYEPRMNKIAEIVNTDIGMTVKILQIVNSAFFGLTQHISDVTRAINFLGLDTLKSLTLGAGIFSQLESSKPPDVNLSAIWEHSFKVAHTAKSIAQNVNPSTASDAFTAGLLHDIGDIVIAVNLPKEFAEVRNLIEKENMPQRIAEKMTLDATHSEIGAYLVGLWGLPHQVVEAVAFHNIPHQIQTNYFTSLTAVHIANAFHHYSKENIFENPERYFDVQYLNHLNLMDKLPIWHTEFIDCAESND